MSAGQPGPRYPEGTPEYEAYTARLRAELAAFVAGEPPYDTDDLTEIGFVKVNPRDAGFGK